MRRLVVLTAALVAASLAEAGLFSGPKPLFENGRTEWTAVVAADAGVALSSDGKTVYVDAGEGEGCYLAYQVEKILKK